MSNWLTGDLLHEDNMHPLSSLPAGNHHAWRMYQPLMSSIDTISNHVLGAIRVLDSDYAEAP